MFLQTTIYITRCKKLQGIGLQSYRAGKIYKMNAASPLHLRPYYLVLIHTFGLQGFSFDNKTLYTYKQHCNNVNNKAKLNYSIQSLYKDSRVVWSEETQKEQVIRCGVHDRTVYVSNVTWTINVCMSGVTPASSILHTDSVLVNFR